MAIFNDQLRQVMRRLGRAPLFTAVTLITLAVGVGANTVIFSVVEGVLLKPLPYPHAEQLIGVWHTAPGIGMKDLNMAPSIYFIDREQSTTFQDIGVYDGDSLSVTGAGEPEHVAGLDVSDGTLPILGVVPALGRLFTREDDSPGKPETVLLSYAYWRRKFGGDSSVIGRSITVDGKPRMIIGVLPQGFQFLDDPDDLALFLPFQWDRSKTKLGNFSYEALARLKPGVTMAQASADMARLLPVAIRSFPAPDGFSAKLFESAHITSSLRPLKQQVVGDIGNVLWVLMGSIGIVLLIACANVANLLLVRVEGRRQELSIRAALGAGVKRIAADLLFESAVLGVLGSLLGLILAEEALRVLVSLGAYQPSAHPRNRHRSSGIAVHARAGHLHQPCDCVAPGLQVRRWTFECQPARGWTGAERKPRAAPRAQRPGDFTGGAGAGFIDLFRTDDPHLSRFDACASRIRSAGFDTNIPPLRA